MFHKFIRFPDDLETSEEVMFRLEHMAAVVVQNSCRCTKSLEKDYFETRLSESIALSFRKDFRRCPESPELRRVIEQFVLRCKADLYQYVLANHGTDPEIMLPLRELLEICEKHPSIRKLYTKSKCLARK